MLDLTTMELAELLSACDIAIKNETELAEKYKDVAPWRAEQHNKSLRHIKSAKEKIYQFMKGE